MRAAVPKLKIVEACRDVTHQNTVQTYDECMAQERTVRQDLERAWESYPAAARKRCINVVTPPAVPSYLSLQDCLSYWDTNRTKGQKVGN
jgi:hypothetical protein